MNNNLQCLIDGDLLVHEISVLGEYYDEGDTEKTNRLYRDFRYLEAIVENRIMEICEAVGSTLDPVIYLSGKNNFRYDIATVKPYKGNRKSEKPVHWENVYWFLRSRYNAIVVDGMEADDALAIHQMESFPDCPASGVKAIDEEFADTVICTRDKDLRQVPGWHYGWEVGLQPEFKLRFIPPMGYLKSEWKIGVSPKTGKETNTLKKITGGGLVWFYTQVLVGDNVDNIPGLPGCGPKRALELLEWCETEQEMFDAVKEEYQKVYGEEEWERQFLEQARLVWMVRELNEDGSPKMWEFPDAKR